MHFELYGYGAGSTADRQKAKQYRRLRVDLDLDRTLKLARAREQSDEQRWYGLSIAGVTAKQSPSDNNRCSVRFKEGSALENLEVASLFLEHACYLLAEEAKLGKLSTEFIPSSDPGNLKDVTDKIACLSERLQQLVCGGGIPTLDADSGRSDG